LAVIYDETFLKHDLPSHPENTLRLKYFMKPIFEMGIPILKPKQVSYDVLRAVHSGNYITDVITSCRERAPGFFDPDTYYNSFTCDAALLSAGANELGIELLAQGNYEAVFCAVRPPGHHAERERAMGFCIFNNVAVAAVKALSLGFKKVFIADFDAHHGNGTQKAFYDFENVFYFSTHQYPFYPGTGGVEENNEHVLNLPMKEGSGDKEYRKAFGITFCEAVERFNPDIILVSAGYDLHKDDPLTDLEVTDKGVEFIVSQIVEEARKLSVPLLFTLEGGYSLRTLENCSKITMEVILGG
jgi:acetoin utilization deacetylase AcuC-like enzyme